MPSFKSCHSNWLTEMRRHFHMFPELSFQEHETTKSIVKILSGFHLPVTTLDDLTGASATIIGTRNGPSIGLRADIDALPVTEQNDTDHRSRNDGVMHACGHDAHTAILLGVAKTIVEGNLANQLSGNVKLIFQPAEEKGSGARAMIERGVLESPHVDCLFALHITPDLPAGAVGLFKGVGFASADRFDIRITGKGAHGARPEEGIDPVVAGARLILALQTLISREIKPADATVITVGKFVSGSAANIIPESAHLEGTMRTLSDLNRKHLIDRIAEVVSGIEKIHRVTCDLRFHDGTPALANDPGMADLLCEAAGRVVGRENIHWMPPSMGAEDFSFFAEKQPSALFRLGCSREKGKAPFGLHNPCFEMDESALEIGCNVFLEAIRMILVEDPDSLNRLPVA